MEIGITGSAGKTIEELIDYAKRNRFPALQPLCMAQNLPELMTKSRIAKIKKESENTDLFLHPPVVSLGYYEEEFRKAALDVYKQTVDFAKKVNAKGVLVHHLQILPGFWTRFLLEPRWKKIYLKRFKEDFNELARYAKRRGVVLVQEQLEGMAAVEIKGIVKNPNTKVAYDLSHSFAESESIEKICKDLRVIGNKLVLVHIHSLPSSRKWTTEKERTKTEIMKSEDVLDILKTLKEIDFQGAIIIEESKNKRILRTKKYLERRL